jgi:hypothetical protein
MEHLKHEGSSLAGTVQGHTQGELRVSEGFPSVEAPTAPHLALCNDPNIPMAERMANARRIALCWNAHDELVAVVRKLMDRGISTLTGTP